MLGVRNGVLGVRNRGLGVRSGGVISRKPRLSGVGRILRGIFPKTTSMQFRGVPISGGTYVKGQGLYGGGPPQLGVNKIRAYLRYLPMRYKGYDPFWGHKEVGLWIQRPSTRCWPLDPEAKYVRGHE